MMMTDAELASYLRRHWGLEGVRIAVHNGGMGSATWFVERGASRWVAKAVTRLASGPLAAGLEIARRLEHAGIPAGAAVPACDGRLTVEVDGGALALLTYVAGEPLTGKSSADRRLIGTTLARVHCALAGQSIDGATRFHWVDTDADFLSIRPWLRPAIAAALDVLDAAEGSSMCWGLLHCDPAPGAFRHDPATGRCGVIDWSYAVFGPLLYDIASAVMFVGGIGASGELVEAYLRAGFLGRAEVVNGLAPMLRFRWAVQANYFAWRIATDDLTGISGPGDNEKGLEDARLALASAG